MRGRRSIGFVAAVAAGTFALGPAPGSGALAEAGCKLTGGGTADSGDRIRANAKVTKGQFTGKVKLVSAAGDRFRGVVTVLACRRDGGGGPGSPAADVNIADIEGFGALNGVPGYEFAATLHDHGEGVLTDRLPDDWAATVVFGGFPVLTAGGLFVAGGNVQIHAPTDAHP